ncbi:MAG: hypothetical protein WC765_06175 [Phycisphaerae bacterium]|jgi:hypothetical protein
MNNSHVKQFPTKQNDPRASRKRNLLKMCLSAAALGASMVVMAQAGEDLEIMSNNSFEETKGDVPTDWVANELVKPMGTMRVLTEKAKDGEKCIEIKTIPSYKFAIYHKEPIGVVPGDKIKLNVYVKGTGRFRFDLYLYCNRGWDFWGRNIQDGQVFDVDSEEWSLQTFELEVPSEENDNGVTVNYVRPAIAVLPNSSLQFDCFTGTISK